MAWIWHSIATEAPLPEVIRTLNRRLKDLEHTLGLALGAAGIGTANDADATPDVAGLRVLITANTTGATTITGLDGGASGQKLIIRFGDANTTLQHGTNLQLNADADFTGASGDAIAFFTEDGTLWRQYPQPSTWA